MFQVRQYSVLLCTVVLVLTNGVVISLAVLNADELPLCCEDHFRLWRRRTLTRATAKKRHETCCTRRQQTVLVPARHRSCFYRPESRAARKLAHEQPRQRSRIGHTMSGRYWQPHLEYLSSHRLSILRVFQFGTTNITVTRQFASAEERRAGRRIWRMCAPSSYIDITHSTLRMR